MLSPSKNLVLGKCPDQLTETWVEVGCGEIFSMVEINSALAAVQWQHVGWLTTRLLIPLLALCPLLLHLDIQYTTHPLPCHLTPMIYCLFHLSVSGAFWGAGTLCALHATVPCSLCPISSWFLRSVSKQSISFPRSCSLPLLGLVVKDQGSSRNMLDFQVQKQGALPCVMSSTERHDVDFRNAGLFTESIKISCCTQTWGSHTVLPTAFSSSPHSM